MEAEKYLLKENNGIPNNKKLPLLKYKQVFETNTQEQFEKSFSRNGWGGQWVNGIYTYHHYHSTAHEVLGVIEGQAKIIFGGPDGKLITISTGDMVIIPAGTGHCRINATDNLKVMGAYPHGQENYDICTTKDDVEEKKNNIDKVPLPDKDPIQDSGGILKEVWR